MGTLGWRGVALQPSGITVSSDQGVFVAMSGSFFLVQNHVVSSDGISKLLWFGPVVGLTMLTAFSGRFALDFTSVANFAVWVLREVCEIVIRGRLIAARSRLPLSLGDLLIVARSRLPLGAIEIDDG